MLTFTCFWAVQLFYELIASQLQGIVHLTSERCRSVCTTRSAPIPRHFWTEPYKMFERGGIVESAEHHSFYATFTTAVAQVHDSEGNSTE